MTRSDLAPVVVPIPAGPFTMGTSDDEIERIAALDPLAAEWKASGRFSREQPQHEVTLRAFSIAVHPVTVGTYRRFVEGGGYSDARYWLPQGWAWVKDLRRACPDHWDDANWAGDERLPAVGVSWFEAHAFCCWLSEAVGLPYRLPSEAEWEAAARGGDARVFSWGDAFDPARCSSRESGWGRTRLVGVHGATDRSPYGCEEMAGNVSEWTCSLFRPYPYIADDGRESVQSEGERVIRGGSWAKPAMRSRVAARGMNDPWFTDTDVGFRVALYASGLRTT